MTRRRKRRSSRTDTDRARLTTFIAELERQATAFDEDIGSGMWSRDDLTEGEQMRFAEAMLARKIDLRSQKSNRDGLLDKVIAGRLQVLTLQLQDGELGEGKKTLRAIQRTREWKSQVLLKQGVPPVSSFVPVEPLSPSIVDDLLSRMEQLEQKELGSEHIGETIRRNARIRAEMRLVDEGLEREAETAEELASAISACLAEAIALKPARFRETVTGFVAGLATAATAIKGLRDIPETGGWAKDVLPSVLTEVRGTGRGQEAAVSDGEVANGLPGAAGATESAGVPKPLGSPEPISVDAEATLRRRIEADDVEAYRELGDLLNRQSRLAEAEVAYRGGIEAGDRSAYRAFGDFLEERDRSAEAELVYRDALAAGVIEACDDLGYLLEIEGRLAEAEEIYRIGIENGYRDAFNLLGELLSDQEGREQEAEKLFLAGIEAGDTDNFLSLGNLLEDQGRVQEAEQAFREAIKAGETGVYQSLGNLLEVLGRQNEAVWAFREAESVYRMEITSGDTAKEDLGELYFYLGYVLAHQPGQELEAEVAYREAINWGDTEAFVHLGQLLREMPGREYDAEQAYRAAIEAEETDAYLSLADLLAKQSGREVEAEAAYRRAIAVNDSRAYFNFANLLGRLPGREAEAEQLYRSALNNDESAGHYINLGNLLAKQPGREADAERAFRQAIANGNSGTYLNLINLLLRQPERQSDASLTLREAESAFLSEIENGDSEAYFHLGNVLEKQSDREADAERAYRTAIMLDVTKAYRLLGFLLMRQDHLKEAEWAFRRAIAAGDSGGHAGLARLQRRKEQLRHLADRNKGRTVRYQLPLVVPLAPLAVADHVAKLDLSVRVSRRWPFRRQAPNHIDAL